MTRPPLSADQPCPWLISMTVRSASCVSRDRRSGGPRPGPGERWARRGAAAERPAGTHGRARSADAGRRTAAGRARRAGCRSRRQRSDELVGAGQPGGPVDGAGLAPGWPSAMLSAALPENRYGCCGTQAICRRHCSRSIAATSPPPASMVPAAGGREAEQQGQERALARAAWAGQHDLLTGCDGQADPVQRGPGGLGRSGSFRRA